MNFIFLALIGMLVACSPPEPLSEKPTDSSVVEEPTEEVVDTETPSDTAAAPEDTSSVDTGVCDTAEEDPIDWETCSFQIGDHICNISLPDVDTVVHELYSYYGRPMVIQISAEWCSPCRTAGTFAESFMQRYAAEDLLWITIIIENTSGEPATNLDLIEWEAEMGTVNALTLAGSRDLIDLTAQTGFPVSSWPTFAVINDDMTIYHGFYGWSESYLTSVLDTMFGS